MMLDAIRLMYAYDEWATARLLESLAKLSEDEYKSADTGGLGTIHKAVIHLLTATWGWFVWFETATSGEASRDKLKAEDFSTREELQAKFAELHPWIESYLDGLTEEQVATAPPVEFDDGSVNEVPLGQDLLHVANHATHTRAQIIMAIRQCGHEPEQTDLCEYTYLRVKGEL